MHGRVITMAEHTVVFAPHESLDGIRFTMTVSKVDTQRVVVISMSDTGYEWAVRETELFRKGTGNGIDLRDACNSAFAHIRNRDNWK